MSKTCTFSTPLHPDNVQNLIAFLIAHHLIGPMSLPLPLQWHRLKAILSLRHRSGRVLAPEPRAVLHNARRRNQCGNYRGPPSGHHRRSSNPMQYHCHCPPNQKKPLSKGHRPTRTSRYVGALREVLMSNVSCLSCFQLHCSLATLLILSHRS